MEVVERIHFEDGKVSSNVSAVVKPPAKVKAKSTVSPIVNQKNARIPAIANMGRSVWNITTQESIRIWLEQARSEKMGFSLMII